MSVLSADGVIAGYGDVEILHGVSVRVDEGEIVAIIGPNGAGKSTLIKAIFGLVRINDGQVRLGGADVTGERPDRLVKHGIAYVPQVDNVFASLTVEDNLQMGAWVEKRSFRERAQEVYGLFPDLATKRRERAGRLSGGQRQLLAIGRALMLRPSVLLLDEPSASLSPKMAEVVFQNIAEVNARGTSILMVEQNARHAMQMSARTYVLATGENRLEGPSGELLESEEVRRLYLGE
jgi:ABC-type branched-subunit amino acid transport system ATPase component